MAVLIDSLQCWWRYKEPIVERPLTPPPSAIDISKPLVDFECSSCFKFFEYENAYIKKAKIVKKMFVFCDEDCYGEWLSSPGTMLIGKLN